MQWSQVFHVKVPFNQGLVLFIICFWAEVDLGRLISDLMHYGKLSMLIVIGNFCLNSCQISITQTAKQWHEISNNVICATSKSTDQTAHMCRLIRAFASCLHILWLLSYWLKIILSFSLTEGYTGLCKSTNVKMPHFCESHVIAQLYLLLLTRSQWRDLTGSRPLLGSFIIMR